MKETAIDLHALARKNRSRAALRLTESTCWKHIDPQKDRKFGWVRETFGYILVETETLLQWDRLGLIPGPDEAQEAYERRVRHCLRETEELEKSLGLSCPFVPPEQASRYFAAPLRKTEELFGIAPAWVPLFFHNRGLSYWHGGCAWIYQLTTDQPRSAFLQLRKSFQDHGRFLIYDRDEIIAHEMVHVARMAFEEPAYEEIFAYRTSPSSFRKLWGPLFSQTSETSLFVILCLIPLLATGISFFYPLFFTWTLWSYLPLFLFLSFCAGKLFQRQRRLKRCMHRLIQICKGPREAQALAMRLSDREIERFGLMDAETLRGWILDQAEDNFRWKILSSYTQKNR